MCKPTNEEDLCCELAWRLKNAGQVSLKLVRYRCFGQGNEDLGYQVRFSSSPRLDLLRVAERRRDLMPVTNTGLVVLMGGRRKTEHEGHGLG